MSSLAALVDARRHSFPNMNNLSKPQPCGQPWLAMQPTTNGRLCGQCDKEIYDFSGMAWPAIARTQAAHGNALCGMYTPAQLKHWGQTPPPSACARVAAATTLALALALAAIPAAAQTPGGRTLSGTVMVVSDKGQPEPVPFATVLLAGTQVGVATDEQGRYELTLPDEKSLPEGAAIRISSLGLTTDEWPLPPPGDDPLRHDAVLHTDPNNNITTFSVRRPSLPERAWWSLKRRFGRRAE